MDPVPESKNLGSNPASDPSALNPSAPAFEPLPRMTWEAVARQVDLDDDYEDDDYDDDDYEDDDYDNDDYEDDDYDDDDYEDDCPDEPEPVNTENMSEEETIQAFIDRPINFTLVYQGEVFVVSNTIIIDGVRMITIRSYMSENVITKSIDSLNFHEIELIRTQ